jgi:heptose I phosphotransferase
MHANSTHSTKPVSTVALGDLTVHPAHVDVLRNARLDSLGALFAIKDGRLLSKPGLDSWRKRLRIALPGLEGEFVYFLKRFEHPPSRDLRAMRRSTSGARSCAYNEWTWIQRLSTSGIPCLEAVAVGQELHRGREVRSAILTAQVPGQSLESWCKEWTRKDRATTRTLIPAVATLVRKLHAAGLFHRDLYLCHIFFDPRRPIADGLRLIDLQRVIQPTWRRGRWAVKDLAALNYSTPATLVSRADRVRFLRPYLGVEKLGAAGKALAYRVIGKTASIAAKDRKRVA